MSVLNAHLAAFKKEIQGYAEEFGLDFFEVVFEVLDWKELNMTAAYGGFPTRYPHWRFGMEYEQLMKSYSYGLSKIYELVINNDPCYAYLLHSNLDVDQKLVMAHVYGHCDFFKNNLYFAHTNRKMMDEMANHAMRVRRYVEQHGAETVERFIDTCLSLEHLIDMHSTFIKRPSSALDDSDNPRRPVKKLKSKAYMDRYINPKEFIEAQQKKMQELAQKQQGFPSKPVKDTLLFLIENAPLAAWERDILSIIREESYYFAPQAQTKVMNEGWASYWHSTIMTTRALNDSEVIDYADHHSGTLATTPTSFNPYKLGIELFRDIEERWNKGRFGKEYDECDNMQLKRKWDKQLGKGREKIFEVRKVYNDVTFIDAFLTEAFCHKHKMFVYDYNPATKHYEISNRDFGQIKQRLLFQLTNYGLPHIYVVDGNYQNRGELLLHHKHAGVDMKLDESEEVLKNIQALWKRPVHLETLVEGQAKLLSFDGKEQKKQNVDQLSLL